MRYKCNDCGGLAVRGKLCRWCLRWRLLDLWTWRTW